MSKKGDQPKRRESPLRGPGGRGLDPHVQATLRRAARKLGDAEWKQYNLSLPADLMEAVREEATRLTGHRRRGFADLVAVLIEYGWEAYLNGELEVEMRPVATNWKIARAK